LIVSRAENGEDWDAFVSACPGGTVDHLWGWREVIARSLGHESVYLMVRQQDAIVGVLPLVLVRSRLFGRSVVSMPFLNHGGILADDRDAAAALVDAARQVAIDFRASHVELRHITRCCPDLPCRRHKLSMTLALAPSVEAVWTGLDRKVRNQVRKAQKEQLQVESGGVDLVDEFYAVFARNMRDLGTPVYPKQLFVSTLTTFADRARVFVVRHQGRAAAAGVSLGLGGTVLNPWASSLREFRHLSPNMLLYWAMIEEAVNAGATTFDFGRSSPDSGTQQFKRQGGAVETPMYWEYILLSRAEAPDHGPSNPKFERAIRAWQSLPLSIANAIGPRIARHLP
jgi:FemAB-related protein (PEP-CTERM system-associated)